MLNLGCCNLLAARMELSLYTPNMLPVLREIVRPNIVP